MKIFVLRNKRKHLVKKYNSIRYINVYIYEKKKNKANSGESKYK